jgi:hypothetical protein
MRGQYRLKDWLCPSFIRGVVNAVKQSICNG